jgi:TonB-dependent receptor
MTENYRSWSNLDERTWRFETDLDFQVPITASRVKLGTSFSKRERTFDVKSFTTDQSKLHWKNAYLVVLPMDSIFLPENYGPGKFQFISQTQYTGMYEGQHDIGAGYAMVDQPLAISGLDLRLVGGLRVEDSDQVATARTANPLKPFSEARVKKTDWLPSCNLTYLVSENANVRLAYSRSVNRPEFREMADVKYYDFNEFQNVIGNPNLNRASIHNYDIRFEFFPSVGEVMAVSFFHKNIEDAIEIKLLPEPTRFVRTWFNSPDGENYGWELELRKSLGFLGGYFSNFMVTGNYTRVESAIQYVEKKTSPSGPVIRTLTRPMQGQTPWMFNCSLVFAEPTTRTKVGVLYNKIGRRLYAVGDSRFEDVYEEPPDMLDLSVTQGLAAGFETKLALKNILAEDEIYTMGPDTVSLPFKGLNKGTSYSLSISWSL